MRIAIAGTTGLIGSGIAGVLAAEGHAIVPIGRAVEGVRFDLANPEGLDEAALAGCDLLVHAAGVIDEDFRDRDAAQRKAIGGAQALVAAAMRARIPRLAYVSSAHVYGPLEGRIDEASPLKPANDYAAAHVATESLFTSAGAAALITRPCAVFGMPPSLAKFVRWSLIPFDFPRQALAGEIVLKSAGLQRRNFVSSEGIGRLVGWWLASSREGTTVANAPGPHEMAVYDFAQVCARIAEEETGRPCRVRRAEGPPPPGPPFEYRTRVGGHLRGTPLEDHVRALIRALRRAQSMKKESP